MDYKLIAEKLKRFILISEIINCLRRICKEKEKGKTARDWRPRANQIVPVCLGQSKTTMIVRRKVAPAHEMDLAEKSAKGGKKIRKCGLHGPELGSQDIGSMKRTGRTLSPHLKLRPPKSWCFRKKWDGDDVGTWRAYVLLHHRRLPHLCSNIIRKKAWYFSLIRSD